MGLFTSRKVKQSAYIVCTVEAHSVSCAIYLHKEKPEIIFAARNNAVYRSSPDAKRIFDKVNDLFKNLLQNDVLSFIKHNGDNFEFVEATIVHSLLWSHEETRHLSHHSDKEFEITEKYVNHVMETEHNNVSKDDNYVVVKSVISNMHINGYVTASIYGKLAKSFSCILQRTKIDKLFTDSLEEKLQSFVKTEVIHTTEFDLFDVFIPFVGAGSKMLAMSFGSETIEIAIYNHSERKNSISVPFGVESLVRNVSEQIHKDESVAFSHVAAFVHGERVSTESEKVVIDESMKLMKQKVNKALFDAGEAVEGIDSVICLYPEVYRSISNFFLKNFLLNNSVVIIDPYTTRAYKDSILLSQPIFYTDPLVEIAVLSANKK